MIEKEGTWLFNWRPMKLRFGKVAQGCHKLSALIGTHVKEWFAALAQDLLLLKAGEVACFGEKFKPMEAARTGGFGVGCTGGEVERLNLLGRQNPVIKDRA